MIHIVSLEGFKMSFLAPIIYWRCAVSDYFWNVGRSQHIGVLRKKFRVIQPHIFKSLFGYFGVHFDGIVPLVPTCRCGIGFGEYFSLFKICNNISLFDFVTASFLARVFARNLSASKQIQGRWFTDVADLIELVFGNNIGNRSQLIAVSFIAIHLVNILVGAVLSCVLPLLMCLFCSFRSSFQNSACSFRKQRKCRYSNFLLFFGISTAQPPKSL